ncbi:MAG: 16S rRNA (adenine(1518)-N(6)/adenine(1519)-N(6))-dimethyltransferase RsmA, partial [Ottowia sp.]|nr:16S rRNA (adenine(1518)-N(6)/adenine(1519)-N(6))-dimethyltransferase RsmA [Ottowia sp.]
MPFARKRFGQHFLHDAAVVDAIVRAIAPQDGQAIVEIGPGRGALTAALLQRVPHITAIELDRDLAALLRAAPSLAGRLTLMEGDALRTDWGALRQQLGGAPLRVVGNLPYNISTPLLLALLHACAHISDQHFMLQREVAERISAPAGSSAYGRLSVMLQWRYHMETVIERVPPAAFAPPPRVDSAVIRMTPREDAPSLDTTLLTELLRCAFAQRRKLLRHTLEPWLAAR